MKTIWKYPIPLEDEFSLELPKGAEILHFGIQRGKPYIWALVTPVAPTIKRNFRLSGTGHDILQTNLQHIGTVLMLEDNLVWHLFENQGEIIEL